MLGPPDSVRGFLSDMDRHSGVDAASTISVDTLSCRHRGRAVQPVLSDLRGHAWLTTTEASVLGYATDSCPSSQRIL